MPVDLIPEEQLRLALSVYRVDPAKFESAVRERTNAAAGQEIDPLATMSPLLRVAASLLPVEVLTAGQSSGTAVQSASIAGVLSKFLGVVAFPAISVFVLLGAAVFGIAGVRRIRNANGATASGEEVLRATVKQWWRDHRRGGWLLLAVTIALAWYGATSILFLGYIVSILILLYVLKSFAKIGIGNRLIVGQSCISGLLFLGQTAGFAGIGDQEIHLIDPMLLVPVSFAGALVISVVMAHGSKTKVLVPRTGMFAVLALALAVWFMNPILWPATPARINDYVESFDRAEFSSASWRSWEIVTSGALKSGADLDLSRPRRLLSQELSDQQTPVLPMILGSAFHAGLVAADQVSQIRDYESRLRTLLAQPVSDRISPLDFNDWLIRAALLRGDLTPEQRDYLVERLHVTLRSFLTRPNPGTLQEPLLATELLEVLGRSVNPVLYGADMQALLVRFHAKTGGGFRRAGGFKLFENLFDGEIEATSDAVRLMEIYGIPKDFDMNWVRSFLRPSWIDFSPQKWIAAVTLDRLNRLPGITRPSWYQTIYYERSFLAALILISLCIYATVISPRPVDN